MLIKNTCARLIAVGDVRIAPNKVEEVADSFAENPVIKNYINAKELRIVDSIEEAEAEAKEEAEKAEAEKAEAEGEKPLDKMTKDQLVALAEEKGIDLTGAGTKAEIIALISNAE